MLPNDLPDLPELYRSLIRALTLDLPLCAETCNPMALSSLRTCHWNIPEQIADGAKAGKLSCLFRPFGRRCAPRVIGPGVFRIAPLHLFFDLMVGTIPESLQIARDLKRPAGR